MAGGIDLCGGFFNATGLAEIRLGALESDLSRRNQTRRAEIK